MHGILSDLAIRQSIVTGDIKITPYNPEQLNITSYDLTLGDQVSVYKPWVSIDHVAMHAFPECALDGGHLRPRVPQNETDAYYNPSVLVHSAKQPMETLDFRIQPKLGWILQPGIGYLMHTQERVCTRKYNPILDGKSSIGRLFIQVHATAGYGDPGFDGQYTLEVIVQHPIRVYPGMRFCQIRFHTIAGELSKTYDQVGHYTGDQAQGAIPSQAWRQFKTEV